MGSEMCIRDSPRILPTMESHRSASESLFDFLSRVHSEGLSMLIGKELLEPWLWSLDSQSLDKALEVAA